MAIDPNDPLAQYLDASAPLDGDALFNMYFGTQAPTVVPPIESPIPAPPPPPTTVADLPMQAPRGSTDTLRGAPTGPVPPTPPPVPQPPPGPGEPYRPTFAGTEEFVPPTFDRGEIDLGAPEIDMPPDEGRPAWLGDVLAANDQAQKDVALQGFQDQLSGKAQVDARAAEFAADPLKYETYLQDRNKKRGELEAEASGNTARMLADAERIKADASDATMAKLAKLDQDVAALSSDETWFDRQGTGTQFAGYLAAALAGFLNPTGPNSAVELIKSANEGDIRRRQAAISAGRDAVSAGIEGAQAVRDASVAATMANYQVAITEIDQKMNALDPLGTKAANLAATRNALIGEMRKAAKAAQKEWFDQSIKEGEFNLKVRKQALDEATAKYPGQGTGTGGGSLAPTGIAGQGGRSGALTGDQWRNDKGMTWLPPDIDRPSGYTLKEIEQAQKLAKFDQPLAQGTIGSLKQPDNSPFRATGTDAMNDRAVKLLGGMRAVVSAIDMMARNRDGFSSDWFGSDENQTVNSAWQRARLHLGKTFELGALSEEDLKIVDGFLTSGKNPTGFRSVLTSLETARGAIIEDTQNALVDVGFRGDLRDRAKDPINGIPPPPKAGRTQSQDEKTVANVIRVGNPKVIGPLAKRLGAVAVDGADDPNFNKDAATATLRRIAKKGGKYGKYADNLLKLADIPRYKAQWEAENESYKKLTGTNGDEEKPANPDADFFEETPADYEARLRRDIAKFEEDEADKGRLEIDPGVDDIVTGGE